jgi:hypothetical protein
MNVGRSAITMDAMDGTIFTSGDICELCHFSTEVKMARNANMQEMAKNSAILIIFATFAMMAKMAIVVLKTFSIFYKLRQAMTPQYSCYTLKC